MLLCVKTRKTFSEPEIKKTMSGNIFFVMHTLIAVRLRGYNIP